MSTKIHDVCLEIWRAAESNRYVVGHIETLGLTPADIRTLRLLKMPVLVHRYWLLMRLQEGPIRGWTKAGASVSIVARTDTHWVSSKHIEYGLRDVYFYKQGSSGHE